jgi:hypothetical protein
MNWCQYFSERYIHVVRILTWRAWRHVELPVAIAKISWIQRPVAMNTQCRHVGGEKVRTASLLQGSWLARTVGPCAPRRVASGDRGRTVRSAETPASTEAHLSAARRASSEARGEVCSCLSIVRYSARTSPFHDCPLLNSDEFEHRAAVGLRSSKGCGRRKTTRAGSKFIHLSSAHVVQSWHAWYCLDFLWACTVNSSCMHAH